MRKMARIILVILFVGIYCSICHAGVDYFEVPGYSIFPLNNTSVSLIDETVVVDAEDRVHADYVLVNSSDQPVSLTLGLPDLSGSIANSFTAKGIDLKVLEDSKEIAIKRQEYIVPIKARKKIGYSRRGDYRFKFDKLFVWEVGFQPKEKKRISLSYRFQWGLSAESYPGGSSITFVTKTGNMWGVPIKHGRYQIDLDETLQHHLETGRVFLRITPEGYKNHNNKKVVWEFSDYVPTENLQINVWKKQ